MRTKLAGKLDGVYREIRRRAPRATVMVVGYRGSDLIADVTRARAAAHRFTFVDTRRAFDGHGICSDDEWLNGVSDPKEESYHPNRAGHRAFARELRRVMG